MGYPEDYAHDGINVVEGFTYALLGDYEAPLRRLRVTFEVTELWADWCALQTSYPTSSDTYRCLPNCGHGASEGACELHDSDDCELAGPVDCGKLSLCGVHLSPPSVCHCEEAGCTHARSTKTLDLHRMDDELHGTTVSFGNMYLFRD